MVMGSSEFPTLILLFILEMSYMPQNLLKISFLFANSLMKILFLLNLTLLGFFLKDLGMGSTILRCNSTGDLYPFHSITGAISSSNQLVLFALSTSMWHSCLGHPENSTLQTLKSCNSIDCNKAPLFVCHSCPLGKHIKFPFISSLSHCHQPFDIIHTDIWTSYITSSFSFKYYVLYLDHYTNYL